MEEMVGAQRTAHGGWFQSIPPGERGEHPSGLGLAADREREQEALETRRLGRTTVRSHQRGLADADLGVHDLLLETRCQHARRRRSGAVLEAHQHQHFDADRAAIKLEGFVATAVEEEVELDDASPLGGPCRVLRSFVQLSSKTTNEGIRKGHGRRKIFPVHRRHRQSHGRFARPVKALRPHTRRYAAKAAMMSSAGAKRPSPFMTNAW